MGSLLGSAAAWTFIFSVILFAGFSTAVHAVIGCLGFLFSILGF